MNSVEEGIIVLLLSVFLVILETFINSIVDNFLAILVQEQTKSKLR